MGAYGRRSLLEVNYPAMGMGAAVRQLRKRKGLTQEQLARRAAVTKFYISQIETGLRRNPSLPVLRRLAKALGISLAGLLRRP